MTIVQRPIASRPSTDLLKRNDLGLVNSHSEFTQPRTHLIQHLCSPPKRAISPNKCIAHSAAMPPVQILSTSRVCGRPKCPFKHETLTPRQDCQTHSDSKTPTCADQVRFRLAFFASKVVLRRLSVFRFGTNFGGLRT